MMMVNFVVPDIRKKKKWKLKNPFDNAREIDAFILNWKVTKGIEHYVIGICNNLNLSNCNKIIITEILGCRPFALINKSKKEKVDTIMIFVNALDYNKEKDEDQSQRYKDVERNKDDGENNNPGISYLDMDMNNIPF